VADKPHILVVDDEQDIREPVGLYLEGHGFEVSMAGGAAEALGLAQNNKPDLAVLDIMLGPDDGFTLCRDIQKDMDIPVIFLSGKSEETERIIGLELGADDYIVKPFNPRELLARVRAVLRRYQNSGAKEDEAEVEQNFGPWMLDVQNQELVGENEQRVSLSTGEARLLEVFLNHPNQVLNRDQLLDLTHGRQANLFDRSIDNYVSRIRKKIEIDPKNPRLLKTYWGGGYSLNCGPESN
jgi:two-component system OmpR family response regulator